MALEMLNRMGLRWTWFHSCTFCVGFCDVSGLFNVANMRQMVSYHFSFVEWGF